MRERLKHVLHGICASPELEQRFLHTLSLLEFMGARKIGKSVAAHHPPAMVLDHWADETRHAAVLSALASTGPEHVASLEYLCEEGTKAYFQAVDHRISERLSPLGNQEELGLLNYLVVTSVIERRAMMVYPLYRATSQREDVRREISRIVIEEQSHRVSIDEAAEAALARGGHGSLDDYAAIEEELFEGWISELENLVLGMTRPALLRKQTSAVSGAERPVDGGTPRTKKGASERGVESIGTGGWS